MRILIFRSGAFGDTVIITPVIRHLKSQGHDLVVVTSKRGMQVLKNNPHISELVQHNEEVEINKLSDEIERLQKKYKCDKVIDFSESLEVSLSLHPRSPEYKLSKPEKLARFNRNFYEYSFEFAKEPHGDFTPELFFDDSEIEEAIKYVPQDKFSILLGMSGSGNNKAYPYNDQLAEAICSEFPDAHIITVGDEKCRLIEPEIEGRITNLSGKVDMRTSMALTGLVNLVIAPDTGVIHASGCYDTPKICLLGHNTIECITKHFVNDYSIEADQKKAPCAPCLSLIYDIKLQCPIDHTTGGVMCMSKGLPVESIMKKVREVYAKFKERI